MNDAQFQSLMSAIRSVVISGGSVWAAKKGIDGATLEAILGGLIAIAAAAWGSYSNHKRPAQ